MIQLSVNRANIGKKDQRGVPLPCVRIEGDGPTRHAHVVRINGPSQLAQSPKGRVLLETSSPIEEETWQTPP